MYISISIIKNLGTSLAQFCLHWVGLDAWGETVDGSIPMQINRLLKIHDKESGLHYNHHRYYDPALGRYISPDPIGLRGG